MSKKQSNNASPQQSISSTTASDGSSQKQSLNIFPDVQSDSTAPEKRFMSKVRNGFNMIIENVMHIRDYFKNSKNHSVKTQQKQQSNQNKQSTTQKQSNEKQGQSTTRRQTDNSKQGQQTSKLTPK